MPPLFCLFTFAVIALRYRTTHTAETWSRHQAWHLDQLISHMDNLSASVLISKRSRYTTNEEIANHARKLGFKEGITCVPPFGVAMLFTKDTLEANI